MPSSKNVHFGKLHAAHVDDPHNCGAHSGPLRQGSPHVFVQNKPLVREKDLPPCHGRPDHESAANCHVGEGGGSATKTLKHAAVQSAPSRKATAAGDPVDVATGRVFTSVFEFASPALPGFPWERFYSTELAGRDGPLGHGWTHALAQHLEHDLEGVTYHDGEGRRVLLPPLGLGESVQHLDEQFTLAQGNQGEYVLEREDGLTLFFVDESGAGVARLQTAFDAGGQSLVLEYGEEAGLLRRAADSLGNVYRIDSEDGRRWHGIAREATEAEPELFLVRYQYDKSGNLAAAADALGQWRRCGYDYAHRLAENTDRSGYSFFFEYDAQGRCVRTRGQDGLYDLTFTYAEGRPVTTERDALGRTTAYEYSDLGLVTRVVDAAGHAETFTYEDAHQTAHTDALGRITAYGYDPSGRVTSRTLPGGGRDETAHDEDGPASVTDAEGGTLTRAVTPEGRVVVSSPSAPAPLLSVRADPEADCLVVEDGAGQPSRLYADEAGRLARAESPLGRTVSAEYDGAGRLAALADGAGHAVRFTHDALDRLTAVERAGGSGFRLGYDPEGNLTHFVDGNGGVTRFGYEGFHQLRSVTSPDGQAVRLEYDNANRLHRLTDANQSTWRLDHDAVGRVERILHPDGGSEAFSYDPAGQVTRRTARSGAGFDYGYDPDGNLSAIRCGDGTALSFAYDKNGRLTSASGPGSALSFEYDGLGRLTRETQDGQSVAYAYDAAGRLARMTTPGGESIAYAYDADGDLTEITDWNGGRHVFAYGESGAMQSVHAPNGVHTRFEYSPLGLPATVQLQRAGEAAPLAKISLRYDGNDALTEAADSALGRARFAYDPAGRLVRASDEEFAYDGAGNLTRHGRQEYEYDGANRLAGGPNIQCRHDADGNVVELSTPDGWLGLTYDARGLLTRADLPGGGHAEYAYDSLGRRTRKRVGTTETRWLWAGDLLLSETVTNGDGDVTEMRDFLFLPGSFTPLAQRVGGAVFCCHTDGRGAPTRLTDERGQVAWAATYAAYGEAQPRRESLRQPLRLAGQYHDEETGLHQNRWRPFDPKTGRYLSPDPLGLAGGLNLYAYAHGDPVNQADPLGLFPSLATLTAKLLPPQVMQKAQQLRQSLSQGVLNHLGPLRKLLPPATPRPPDPAMSFAHPQRHLPPMPAPAHHQTQAAPRHAPAHHAPLPAQAASRCARSPHAAPAPPPRSLSGFLHNVPGSLQSAGEGILGIPRMIWDTAGDIGTSLSDGADAAYNRAFGDKNIADADDQEAKQADDRTREKVLNLVPFGGSHGGIAHYAEAAGDWATSLSLPPDQAAMMRQEGGAALHRANQYMEDMAYRDPAGFALNVLPLAAVGRAAALGRIGKLADGAEAGAREAAAAGDAAKAARLSEQASRYREAISLSRGGRAGEAARAKLAAAQEKLSAAAKASLAKGKAAVAKRQAARRVAKGNAAAAAMRARWAAQGRGGGAGQPALAHASSGSQTAHSPPIARPNDSGGVSKMAAQGSGPAPAPRGRVAAPGGRAADYKKYKADSDVPVHYRTDPRFRSLATDPAHAGHATPAMRQEAMAGLEAEHQGLVPGPISRGPAEIEFYDGDGSPWDVKTPPSPKPGAPWGFKVQDVRNSIQEELGFKGNPPGTYPNGKTGLPEARRIILDSSYMTPADHAALWKDLNNNLTPGELGRIVEINTRH